MNAGVACVLYWYGNTVNEHLTIRQVWVTLTYNKRDGFNWLNVQTNYYLHHSSSPLNGESVILIKRAEWMNYFELLVQVSWELLVHHSFTVRIL